MHNDWVKYQYYQHNYILEVLDKKPSAKIQKRVKHSLATSLNNLGVIHINKGAVLEGINYYKNALKIQEELEDKRGVAISYNNIGIVYYNQGDIPNALEYFHKSLKLKEEVGNKMGAAKSLTNIGGIYKVLVNYELALKYYKKALKIQDELNDIKGKANCFNHIGFIYEEQGDIELASDYYQKSLAICIELGYKDGIAVSYGNLGKVHKLLNEMQLARTYLLKSLTIREEVGDKRGTVTSLIKLGQLEFELDNLIQAQLRGEKAFELAQELGYPKLIKISADLVSQVYEKQGKGMKALTMFKLSKIMNDSIFNDNTRKASMQQQAKFEYEKQKVLDDADHDKKIAIEKEEQEKQQVIIIAIVCGLLLLIIFLVIIFNRLQVTKKQKKIIEQQKEEVEEARHTLQEKNLEITDSITYAKRIQEAILPTPQTIKELLPDSFVFYQPKDIVAGDFYWVESKNEYVFFAAADCTGHGVPGAMVSVVCNTALNRVIRDYDLLDPGKILDKTREIIVEQLNKPSNIEGYSLSNMNDGMDIALCVLNTKTNELHYSGAHNPLWILREGKDEIEELKATKQSIGRVENPVSFKTHQSMLNKGDTIYLFSDGFADQFGGEKGKKLKYKPFKNLLIEMRNDDMDAQLDIITKSFKNWKGVLEQTDDVCVIGVRF